MLDLYLKLEKNHKNWLKSKTIYNNNQYLLAYSAVKSDIIAVGPTVTSLQLPKIMYIKHPINAEWRPYWKWKENVIITRLNKS